MEENNREEVFCEGRNVEEALQAACDRLNTTPNQVEYEVVESGSGGVLGFLKGRTSRIRVWKKSVAERKLAELLKGFFAALDLGVTFQITRGVEAYEVEIETDSADGLLIGRGGETLAALQHLIARMASHIDENLHVRVDVAGYRRRRQDQLRRRARDLAEKCLSASREMLTEPLPADERRVVHLALADDPRVETRAVGEGLTKRVVVLPVSQKGAAGAPSEAATERPRVMNTARARQPDRFGPRAAEGRGPGSSRSGPARHGPGGRSAEQRSEAGRTAAAAHRGGGRAGTTRRRRDDEGRTAGRDGLRDAGPRTAPVPMASEGSQDEKAEAAHREGALSAEVTPPRRVEKKQDESYFKIPDGIGLVSSPEPAGEPPEEGEKNGEEQARPLTFGRRPQAGTGRRRGR